MTRANHSEACGHCRQSPCCCAVTVCGSPEETMWSGSQVALTWSEAWAIDNPGLVKMQVEGTLSYEAQRERAGFRFGFEAAQARGASRATLPADPAVLGHIGSCMGCFFAELELLDALRDGAEAGEPAEKLLKRVTAVLRDERRPACPAPPADEVTGLLDALRTLGEYATGFDAQVAGEPMPVGAQAAYDRIENHLKGKR